MPNASLAVLALLTVPALGALAPGPDDRPLDLARVHLDGVPADSPLAALVEEARMRLGQAEAFRAALELPAGPERSRALVALAGGDGAMAGPVSYGRPSEAFAALAQAHGAAADPQALAALDTHPLARPLLNVVDRFLLFEAAATAAYGPLAAGMPDATGALEAAPSWGIDEATAFAGQARFPAPDPAALAHLLDARAALADAAIDLASASRSGSSTQASVQLAVPPAFALDLVGVPSTYTHDVALVVDVGGDDLYLNNAGGSNVDPLALRCPNLPGTGSFATGAAALLDLAGGDRYESGRSCGINGGGRLGAGFLYDAGGSDSYRAGSGGTNGGGWAGLGFLHDAGDGQDAYLGWTTQTQVLGVWGVNGGGMGHGEGFLLDEGGPDSYTAGTGGTNGGGYLPGSRGLLVDGGDGRDLYSGNWLGTNGGANYGSSGALLDGGGDDRYVTSTVVQFGYGANGGGSAGAGFLYDAGGSDDYGALDSGTNGGANAGVGVLIDEGGDDRYRATGTTGNGAAFAGLGLLWDRAGADTYSDGLANCSDCTIVPKGAAGAQVDGSPRLR
jgi:hypothetical protein